MDCMKLNYIDIFQREYSFFVADTVFVPGSNSQEHCHNFYEVFLVKEGELVHAINGSSHILRKGDLCFVNPNDKHSFSCLSRSETTITNLAFIESEFKNAMSYLYMKHTNELQFSSFCHVSNRSYESILKNFDEIYAFSSADSGIEVHAKFRFLLLQVLLELQMNSARNHNEEIPPWLSKACRDMERTENLQIGIKQLVRLSGRTQEHLTRSMKKYLKQSPSQFINSKRLNLAAKLLRNTNATVSEISYSAGFENPSYFMRLFKSEYKCSPSQYRKQNNRIVHIEE